MTWIELLVTPSVDVSSATGDLTVVLKSGDANSFTLLPGT